MISAIILAGGRGKRMGADVSKQFIHIDDKPLIYYTLKRFITCALIDQVVLVLPKNEIEYCKNEILNKYSLKVDYIVEGGAERQDSVYNGLKVLSNTDIVLIHDGARPFVSESMIKVVLIMPESMGLLPQELCLKIQLKLRMMNLFQWILLIEVPLYQCKLLKFLSMI